MKTYSRYLLAIGLGLSSLVPFVSARANGCGKFGPVTYVDVVDCSFCSGGSPSAAIVAIIGGQVCVETGPAHYATAAGSILATALAGGRQGYLTGANGDIEAGIQ